MSPLVAYMLGTIDNNDKKLKSVGLCGGWAESGMEQISIHAIYFHSTHLAHLQK